MSLLTSYGTVAAGNGLLLLRGRVFAPHQNVLLDVYINKRAKPQRSADAHAQIAGRLWRCTDMLPGGDCEILDMPRGSTYAQAARQVTQDIPRLRSHGDSVSPRRQEV